MIKNNLIRYGIKPSHQFMKLQMFIAMCQGINFKLANGKYIHIADEVVNDLFLSKINLANS